MERVLDGGGSTADIGFKGPQWKAIQVDFNNRMGVNFTLSQVQNKYSDLKKRYKFFNQVVGNSDFGWNDEQKKPTAPDEVWDAYLISNPDAKPYRYTTLPNYELCEKIWGGKVATGNFASASIQAYSTPSSTEDTASNNGKRPLPNDRQDSDTSRDDFQGIAEDYGANNMPTEIRSLTGSSTGNSRTPHQPTAVPKDKRVKSADKALHVLEGVWGCFFTERSGE
jgi:hypothetical protein